jgi:hypothetical protein
VIPGESPRLGWQDHRLLAGEAKAAAHLFKAGDMARRHRMGGQRRDDQLPDHLPGASPGTGHSSCADGATEHSVELLELTGPALASNMPPTLVFQKPAADADDQQPPANLWALT